jgi:hypothetical protein
MLSMSWKLWLPRIWNDADFDAIAGLRPMVITEVE